MTNTVKWIIAYDDTIEQIRYMIMPTGDYIYQYRHWSVELGDYDVYNTVVCHI